MLAFEVDMEQAFAAQLSQDKVGLPVCLSVVRVVCLELRCVHAALVIFNVFIYKMWQKSLPSLLFKSKVWKELLVVLSKQNPNPLTLWSLTL